MKAIVAHAAKDLRIEVHPRPEPGPNNTDTQETEN